MDRVVATVEPCESGTALSDGQLRERVARALKGSLGIRVDVEVVPCGTLERASFKADRLTDRRPKLEKEVTEAP
ncbi:MAG: hypothetical protein ACOY3P_09155, partial [Planctomycetota bacterium]